MAIQLRWSRLVDKLRCPNVFSTPVFILHHSDSLWLGTRNRFNEQLNTTTARYTYFVPRDYAWRSLENEFPSVYKKLFMPEFSYHVSLTTHFVFAERNSSESNFVLRPTRFWSATWSSATASLPWATSGTCRPAVISSSTLHATSWRSASWNTISVSESLSHRVSTFLAQTRFRFSSFLICHSNWRLFCYIRAHQTLIISIRNDFPSNFYLQRTRTRPKAHIVYLCSISPLFRMTRLLCK